MMNEIDFLSAASVGTVLWSVDQKRVRALKEAHAMVAMAPRHHAIADRPFTDQSRRQEATVPPGATEVRDDLELEHLIQALLQRVSQEKMVSPAMSLGLDPFYSLSWQSRFLLGAIHRAQFSYRRTARILGRALGRTITTSQIVSSLWQARLELANLRGAEVPPGLVLSKRSCVESFATFEADRGAISAKGANSIQEAAVHWVSRLLDDEIASGTERIKVQNHLMACDSCRHAVGRFRVFWQNLDGWIPGPCEGDHSEEALVQALMAQDQELRFYTTPATRPFREVLRIFLRRPKARVALFVLVSGMIALLVSLARK